jgi:SlyX protein
MKDLCMNERLTELEMRVAFQDQTIQDLNEVVTDQQRQIDRLTQELGAIKSRLAALAPAMVIPQEDEKPPPHY